MSKIRQIEEALEFSLIALGASYKTVEATGDRVLIDFMQTAITACQDVLHDPEEDEEE